MCLEKFALLQVVGEVEEQVDLEELVEQEVLEVVLGVLEDLEVQVV